MTTYAVVSIPKPGAGIAAWLVELDVVGPFASAAEAERFRQSYPISESWAWRVVELVSPEDAAERRNARRAIA